MANTYTQIHIHLVFAVKHRLALIKPSWKEELYKYITGIIRRNGHKLLAINGMPDHVHALVGLRPEQSISELMQDIKGDSSKWINLMGFTNVRFAWQPGYGAFSFEKSKLGTVIRYIQNQERHHAHKSLVKEYKQMLAKQGIAFDERYIFTPPA